MHVLLIAGGWSEEREVALSGAKGVKSALLERGHTVELLDPAVEFDQITSRAREADAAFLALHGLPGEDGLIQAMLDAVGCPYQGADPAGSILALHKAAAKQLFRDNGLPTPDWTFLPRDPGPGWEPAFSYPVFVKPDSGGSSLDARRADTSDELRQALAPIFAKNLSALVEPAMEGLEVTCSVLDDTPLPPILIKPVAGKFFDYNSKYLPGGAEEVCPAPLPRHILDRVEAISLAAHKILNLSGASRSDFILKGDDLYLLEVNTLPGLTPTSLLPQSAAAAGICFGELLERLLELGIRDRRQKGR